MIRDKLEAMIKDSIIHGDVLKVSPFHVGYIKAIKDVLRELNKK